MAFITVVTLLLFYQYHYKRKYGLWFDSENMEETNLESSMIWKLRFLSFGVIPDQRGVFIPKNSIVVCIFKEVSMLEIYDEEMRYVKGFHSPNIVILQEGKDIFSEYKYNFFIRYHIDKENILETTTFIEIDDKEGKLEKIKSVYTIPSKDTYDEEEYIEESQEMIEQIVEEMEERNLDFVDLRRSKIRRSFPPDFLVNEIDTELESDIVIVVLVTNKKKLFGLESHGIEFTSEDKNFIWNPETNDNFASLILEEGEDVEISIKEYLYCECSKILPITLLYFE